MSNGDPDIRKGFSYPNEVRDATIVQNYSESMFAVQAISDFCTELEFCVKNHEEIIKNFYASGGIIEKDRDEDGEILPRRYLFFIGNTLLFVEFDNDFKIIDLGIRWDMMNNHKNRNLGLDIEMICQTATAVFRRNMPEKATEWLNSKSVDVWNADMVRGLKTRGDKIIENPLIAAYFWSGASVETLEKIQNYIAGRPTPPTTDKKTEYGDI